MIGLSQRQVEVALAVLNTFLTERQRAGRGFSPEVAGLRQWLAIMSDIGLETDSATPQLEDDDLIGTAEAAAIIGCSPRHVQRLAADLGAARPGRRALVFERRSVVDYANERRARHDELDGPSNGRRGGPNAA